MEKELQPIAEGREYRRIVNRFIDSLYRQAVCYREAVKSLDSLIIGAERDKNAPLVAYYTTQKEQYTRDLDAVNEKVNKLKSDKKTRDEYVYRLIEEMVSMDNGAYEDGEKAQLRRDRKTLESVINGEVPLSERELGAVSKLQGAILDTSVARALAKVVCGHTGEPVKNGPRTYLYGNQALPGGFIPEGAVLGVRGLTEVPPQEFCSAILKALGPKNFAETQRSARKVMENIRANETEAKGRRRIRNRVADNIEIIKHYADIVAFSVLTVGFFGSAMLAGLALNDEEWMTCADFFNKNLFAAAVYGAVSAGTKVVLDKVQQGAMSPKRGADYSELEELLISALNGEDPKANNERGN